MASDADSPHWKLVACHIQHPERTLPSEVGGARGDHRPWRLGLDIPRGRLAHGPTSRLSIAPGLDPLGLGGQVAIGAAAVEPSQHPARGPGLLHRQRHPRAAGTEVLEYAPSGGTDAWGGAYPGARAARLGHHVLGRGMRGCSTRTPEPTASGPSSRRRTEVTVGAHSGPARPRAASPRPARPGSRHRSSCSAPPGHPARRGYWRWTKIKCHQAAIKIATFTRLASAVSELDATKKGSSRGACSISQF